MSLFALILVLFAALHLAPLRRLRPFETTRDRAAAAIAVALLLAGSMHFTNPARFEAMMPPWIPAHREMISASGLFEILGAVGLFFRRTRKPAAWGLIALLACVFPANLYVAMEGKTVEGLTDARWYYWLRLPFQLVFIVWLAWAAELQTHTSAR